MQKDERGEIFERDKTLLPDAVPLYADPERVHLRRRIRHRIADEAEVRG